MRKELELIEQIESYLMNKLSGPDKITFEVKMQANAGLELKVEFQQNLAEGIRRMGLKNDTVNARKKYQSQRILKSIGIALAIIATLVAATYYYYVNSSQKMEEPVNTNMENMVVEAKAIVIPENDTLSSDANAYLNQELFEIKTDRDTVIESENGIVVFIPAHAFETGNDQVDFLIQEALKPADVLYAGLNTMTAEGEELETGGMFYFDAFAEGERVELSKKLTVDIPSDPNKTGMQLYDGVENEEGDLLWTNPKLFTKPLIPVEITELDFYPRGYEAKMEVWGYLNKQFKDSLYYAFANECGVDDRSGLVLTGNAETHQTHRYSRSVINGVDSISNTYDTLFGGDALLNDDLEYPCLECGVNPASVKTIWNSKFNNTNLATKEFEERMPFIHQTCNNSILEIYINNLDKNLCTVDSMAMRMLSGNNRRIFSNFALKGHGQVKVTTNAQQKLNDYYTIKKQALQQAIAITYANYWDKEDSLNSALSNKEREATYREMENKGIASQKELEFNTNEIYAQLGMKKPVPRSREPVVFNNNIAALNMTASTGEEITSPITPIRANRPFLRANINRTGWKNIDCLMSVSMVREDAKIRGYNERTASVNYSSMTLRVNNAEKYDRVNVYVVPKSFNSYVKLNPMSGEYAYQLNDKLAYTAIAVAWNSEGMFYANIPATPGISAMPLAAISKTDWEGNIKASLGNINNMTEELDYLQYAQKDQDRKNTNNAKRNLRNKARPFVFPCQCVLLEQDVEIVPDSSMLLNRNGNSNDARTALSLPQDLIQVNEDINNQANPAVFDAPQVDPFFKGGTEKLDDFIANNARFPKNLSDKENGTVFVEFTVNKKGKILNPRVRKGLTRRIDREALRIVSEMPDWEPGTLNGKAVEMIMTVPIVLSKLDNKQQKTRTFLDE